MLWKGYYKFDKVDHHVHANMSLFVHRLCCFIGLCFVHFLCQPFLFPYHFPIHSICLKDLNCAPCNPYWETRNFFYMMHSICPKDLNSAPCNPCWYTRNHIQPCIR